MKTYKITSPAYKANGLNGIYCSIAICDDNNAIVDIIGDHKYLPNYKGLNISDIEGATYSDADRFIKTEQVSVDIERLNEYKAEFEKWQYLIDDWRERENAFCNGSKYNFFYDKIGIKTKNVELHQDWLKSNPCPEQNVSYYDFLKSIIHEN